MYSPVKIVKILAAIFSFMLFCSGVLSLLYLKGYVRFNYPDSSIFPVAGIDISHHQGRVDWKRLGEENIRFVYIKATEGGDFQDPTFKRNWRESGERGLYRGAYHFFTFCRPGREQAANFIRNVPDEPRTLPPVLDFEYVGNCRARPEKEALLKEVNDYIAAIEEAYGKAPVFYVTYETYDDYLKGEIGEYELWVRDVFWSPRLPEGRTWTFWQYADHARIDGIKGPVDLNVFRGSEEEFAGYLD